MNTVAEIEEAVRRLPRRERRRLFEWLAGILDCELGVSDPMATYGSAVGKRELFSLEQYFEIEARSSILHEYVAGVIYDMADPSQDHDIIAMNLAAPLHAHVQDRPCRVYLGRRELQFNIGEDDFVYRPDIWMACGEARNEEGGYVDEPCLVIEVLSPSTARFDRREKMFSYREVPSIEEYVIVAQKAAGVTIHRRSEQWRPRVLQSLDDILELQSAGLTLPLARIYKGVSRETLP
jgi:Uma2 family endonuclease